MIIRTRIVQWTEYVSHCEVCAVRIVSVVPGPQRENVTREIGNTAELCPNCAEKADYDTPWMLEEDLEEALYGSLNS